ncbi:hypothetical protein TrVE_jg60 [Triparma verrucosa]|uniref:ABC transporter domain-containing protein n=2 Tax=Triparma verrucosa TaxID=1606542 RepID=A0A9W7DP67_9STRA|nr:hypothetical protein TrVE_jg60 [Triparma verrucosa]
MKLQCLLVLLSLNLCYGKKKKQQSGGGGGTSYDKRSQKSSSSSSSSSSLTDKLDSDYIFSLLSVTKQSPSSERQILSNINLSFYPTAKIGVVGSNGSGKSTLLKIMAGLDTEFSGTSRPKPGARIGYLAQEPVLNGDTVGECIEDAVKESRDILEEYNDLAVKLGEDMSSDEMETVMSRFNSLQDQIDASDLWELDRSVERACESLRCPPLDEKVENLSGGEKRRVALAGLVLRNYDVLLLDEPTNHLDAESVSWLEKFLDQFKGTVVCITHDRYFLENVAQWILELDKGSCYPHEGNYSDWLSAKSSRLESEKQAETALSKRLKSEMEWIKSTPKAKGNKSKSRLNKYEELLLSSTPSESLLRTKGQIYIPPGPRLGDVVVSCESLTKSFSSKCLLNDISFSIPPGGIIGVIGPNGSGKSTLLKMITSELQPDSGTLKIGETVKLVSVGQERDKNLDDTKTAYDEISGGLDEIDLGGTKVGSRGYCSWFGITGGLQQSRVKDLSGGERNRCLLAKMVKSGGNFLLLDEPTNDLDSETIRSLEDALLNFGGSAMVVSHDRYFLDKVATHILAFEGDSKVVFFEGNYGEYEIDKVKRLGEKAIKPITYAKLVNA